MSNSMIKSIDKERVPVIDIKKINLSSSPKDFEKWDSLSNLKILSEIEKEFGKKVNFGELFRIKNVQELINLILK